MIILEPCPFCGGNVDWCKNDKDFHKENDDCHYIICERCGDFSLNIIDSENWDKIYAALELQWNMRANESLVLKIKELIEEHQNPCGDIETVDFMNVIAAIQNLIKPETPEVIPGTLDALNKLKIGG